MKIFCATHCRSNEKRCTARAAPTSCAYLPIRFCRKRFSCNAAIIATASGSTAANFTATKVIRKAPRRENADGNHCRQTALKCTRIRNPGWLPARKAFMPIRAAKRKATTSLARASAEREARVTGLGANDSRNLIGAAILGQRDQIDLDKAPRGRFGHRDRGASGLRLIKDILRKLRSSRQNRRCFLEIPWP